MAGSVKLRAIFLVLKRTSLFLVLACGSFIFYVNVIHVYGHFNLKLMRLEMPGGSYFAPASMWGNPRPYADKIAFFHADGRMLMQPDVEFICFNERFIHAYVDPPGRAFYYEIGADDVVLPRDPEADRIRQELKDMGDPHACRGTNGVRSGYPILLDGETAARRVMFWDRSLTASVEPQ